MRLSRSAVNPRCGSPSRPPRHTGLYGCLRGVMQIDGDIVSPSEDEWDEEREIALILGRDPD